MSLVPRSSPVLQKALRAVGPMLPVTATALAKVLQDTGLRYSSRVRWVSFGPLWCPAALGVHLEPMLWAGCRCYFDISVWKRGTGQISPSVSSPRSENGVTGSQPSSKMGLVRRRRSFHHCICSDFAVNIPFSYKGENCVPSNKKIALNCVQGRRATLNGDCS